MLRRQLERYGKWLIAVGVFAAIAVAISVYIFHNQRLRTPFQDRYVLNAEFAATQGVTPGMSQPVNVAGVRVGTVVDTTLREGRSLVKMEIDPGDLPRVYKNAHLVLVPNSPLKDMQVELFPGSPRAGAVEDGATIPVARTAPPIDSDELTAALDADTRAFFQVLASDLGRGVEGRGMDLRRVFQALRPTAKQAQRISAALAARQSELKRLVHNLAVLSRAAGRKDKELVRVVQAGSATLAALGNEEDALRASLQKLPGTLDATRRTLRGTTRFANELAPAARALLPSARRLPRGLEATGRLAADAAPFLRNKLRPLVRDLQPIARDLAPATKDLKDGTPALVSAFQVLTYVVNELAYNPPGDNEGFLFWTAWFAHNGASFLSTEDAHGPGWRGLVLVDCDTLGSQPGLDVIVDALIGSIPLC